MRKREITNYFWMGRTQLKRWNMKENSRMEDIVSRIICLLFARLIVSNILKWQLFEKLEMRLKPGNRRSFAIEKCLEELGIQSIAGLLNYGFFFAG